MNGIVLGADRRFFAARMIMLGLAVFALCGEGSAFGRSIGPSQELGYGRQADSQIQKVFLISHNPQMTAWVERIGRRLIPFSDRPDLPYTFVVLDEPVVEAFSVPGYIYISEGLLDFIKNDPDRNDELAGVIAHEMGHIGGRHIAKALDEQNRGGFLQHIANLLVGNKYSAADMGPDLYLLGHSSQDEYDADRRAVDTLVRAGIRPDGLVEFLRKVAISARDAGDGLSYLQIHPMASGRFMRIEQQLADDETQGAPQAAGG